MLRHHVPLSKRCFTPTPQFKAHTYMLRADDGLKHAAIAVLCPPCDPQRPGATGCSMRPLLCSAHLASPEGELDACAGVLVDADAKELQVGHRLHVGGLELGKLK